jgi:hypothetical protein
MVKSMVFGRRSGPSGKRAVGLDPVPERAPGQLDHRGDLQEGRRRPAVQGGQARVADQAVAEGQDGSQLIAAPVELHPQEADIRHPVDQLRNSPSRRCFTT